MSVAAPHSKGKDEVKSSALPPYQALDCSATAQKTIREIVSLMAENHELWIGWNRKRFYSLEAKIIHVHPFKFLSSIVLHPVSKNHLQTIFKEWRPFKKMGFLCGVQKGMEREAKNLETYLEAFASEVGMEAAKIRQSIQKSDWEGLTRALIGIDLPQNGKTSPE